MLENQKNMDKNYCRLCLKHDLWNSPLSVFSEGFQISTKILTVHGIQIAESDSFSKVICHLCLAKLEFMDDIRRSVLNSNSILNNIAGEQVVVGNRSPCELSEGGGEGEEEEEDGEEEETTERTCNRCEFVTSCASELSVHLELHNRVSPRNCPRCEVTVPTETELVEHMKQKHKHKTLAIHYCTQCCTLIYGNSQFYHHFRTQHGGGLTDRHQNKKRKRSENRKSKRRKERVKPVEGEGGWKPVETHRERIVLKISKTSEDGSSTRGELMQMETNSNNSQVCHKQFSSNSQGHQLQTSQVAIVNKPFSSNSQGHQLQTSQVAIVNKQFLHNSQDHQMQTSSNSQVANSGINNAQPSSTDVNNSQTTSPYSQSTKGNICGRTENGDATPSKKGRFDLGESQRRRLDGKTEFPQSRLSQKTTTCDTSPEFTQRRLNEKTITCDTSLSNADKCHPSEGCIPSRNPEDSYTAKKRGLSAISSADKCHPSEGYIPSRTEIPEDSHTPKKRGLSARFVPNSMENITSGGHEKCVDIVMNGMENITGKGKITREKGILHEKGMDIVKNGMENITGKGKIIREKGILHEKGVDVVKGTTVSLGKENKNRGDCSIEKDRTAASPGSQNSEDWNIGATAVPSAKENSQDWSIGKDRTAVSPAKQSSEEWNITDEEMSDEETVKVKDRAKVGSSILVDLNESYHDLVIDDEDDLVVIDEEDLAKDMKVKQRQTAKQIPSVGHHGKMPHETSGEVEDELDEEDDIDEEDLVNDMKVKKLQTAKDELLIIDEEDLVNGMKANQLQTNDERWAKRIPSAGLHQEPEKMLNETSGEVEDNMVIIDDHREPGRLKANKLTTARNQVSPQRIPSENLAKVELSPRRHPRKMPSEDFARVDCQGDKLSPWKPNSTLEMALNEWDHKPHPTALANKLKTARKHVYFPRHPQKMPSVKVDEDKFSPNLSLMNETVLDEWDQITASDKIYIDVDDIDHDDVIMMDDHDDLDHDDVVMTNDHDDVPVTTNDDGPMTTNNDDDVSEVLSTSVADGSSSSGCSCCSSLNNNFDDLESLIEVKDEYPSPSYD